MQKNVLILAGILIIAFAAVVAPVMAATAGNATISGNPPLSMNLTVTGTITGWSLDPSVSQPLTNATAVTMTVRSNDRSWVVSAKDGMDNSKTSGTAGKMADWNGTAYNTTSSISLGSAMLVGATTATGFTGATVTLTGSDQAIATGTGATAAAGTFNALPLTFQQSVTYADPSLISPDVYRIIVTFTGSTP
ncbi:MAG: hypothetical protein ABR999_07005 [Methanoregula sp.]|jgi:hypothetical protein|uniref:hypothetical protein n=1 Tax=Methanoregula sp. TaxID=2052170 RepID=UPI003D09B192